MEEKINFLKILEEDNYFNSIKYICNECWEDMPVKAWVELYESIRKKRKDWIKICVSSHILLIRWYQLINSINVSVSKYGNKSHLEPQEIINRDMEIFLVSSLYYALWESMRHLCELHNLNEDEFSEIANTKNTQLSELRKMFQHSLLERYLSDINGNLKILIMGHGNVNGKNFDEIFNKIDSIYYDKTSNKENEYLDFVEVMKNESDFLTKNIASFITRFNNNINKDPLNNSLVLDHQDLAPLTATV